MMQRYRAALAALFILGAESAHAEVLLTGFGGAAFGGVTDRTRGTYGGSLGFLGGGILATRAFDATGSEWHVVQRFDSEESVQAWEDSETRMRWERYANLFAQQTERRNIRGLIGWFEQPSVPGGAAQSPTSPPPSPPPKWKLWFVNMSAVFPPVLIFNLLALPYLA